MSPKDFKTIILLQMYNSDKNKKDKTLTLKKHAFVLLFQRSMNNIFLLHPGPAASLHQSPHCCVQVGSAQAPLSHSPHTWQL